MASRKHLKVNWNVDVENMWASLKNAIQDILNQNKSGVIFEVLFRNTHTMVRHGHGDRLYNGLKEVVTQHLKTKVSQS
jgi:cullin 3